MVYWHSVANILEKFFGFQVVVVRLSVFTKSGEKCLVFNPVL